MKLVVENLTGTLFHIEVSNDATVADLKREIEAQQKHPYHRLILIHDSVPMDEDRTSLVDCGVHDGSLIYIFFNPAADDETETSDPTKNDTSSSCSTPPENETSSSCPTPPENETSSSSTEPES